MSFVYALDCHPSLAIIKEEVNDASHSLISPPTTPSPPFHPLPTATTASRRRGSTTSSLSATKRHRPYTVPARHDTTSRSTETPTSSTMSTNFASWSTTAHRGGHARHQQDARRSTHREGQNYLTSQFLNGPYMGMSDTSAALTTSSSLSNAMGGSDFAPHSRHSSSPESSHSGHIFTGGASAHDNMGWHSSQVPIAMDPSQYPAMPGHNSLSFQDINPVAQMNTLDMNDFTTMTRKVSPGSPHSLGSISPYGVAGANMTLPSQLSDEALAYSALSAYNPHQHQDDEVTRLRRKVRELEDTIKNIRATGSVPSNLSSPEFQAGWKARTAARQRVYCSLNRAGNALCAWHDSRRERRAYPPRNAPPGYLNCGCTHEQALFEESLSRHGVGSYHPGDTVRMDPALRNPLLELLQKRYGYKDGDFDHNPLTETWNQGETPAAWEHKAQAGSGARRRPEPERH